MHFLVGSEIDARFFIHVGCVRFLICKAHQSTCHFKGFDHSRKGYTFKTVLALDNKIATYPKLVLISYFVEIVDCLNLLQVF